MAPIFWQLNTVVFDYGPITAVLICLFLAVCYVGSLYIWTSGGQKTIRDHPSTIKNRFIRVSIICLLVIPFLWFCSSNSHDVKARNLFVWIGLRFKGFVFACIFPLILTMILFLGPLYLHYLDGIFKIYRDSNYWVTNLKNLIWLRNHVVAPVAEEFLFRACMLPFLVPNLGEELAIKICPLFFSVVEICCIHCMLYGFIRQAPLTEEFMFRACMMPLLVPCYGVGWSIVLSPLLFGVAHFHHLYEKIKEGVDIKIALMQSLFQFSYTTVFGAYSAFLFLRTDHLVAPVLAHAFCNHMGFPDLREVMAHQMPQRLYIGAAFVGGLLLWLLLLVPITAPWLYSNDLYYV